MRPSAPPPNSTSQANPVNGPITVQAGSVVAKIAEIRLFGDRFECTIEAAAASENFPTEHDRNHACVASYAASCLAYLSRKQCFTAVLLYKDGTRRRIRIDVSRGKVLCKAIERIGSHHRHLKSAVPAMLVGFLARTQGQKYFRLS